MEVLKVCCGGESCHGGNAGRTNGRQWNLGLKGRIFSKLRRRWCFACMRRRERWSVLKRRSCRGRSNRSCPKTVAHSLQIEFGRLFKSYSSNFQNTFLQIFACLDNIQKFLIFWIFPGSRPFKDTILVWLPS